MTSQHLNQVFALLSADMEEAEQRRQVEEQVELLLSGQGSEVSGCDVGLEQSKPATLRKNVTYIVCAIIFNDKVPPHDSFLFPVVSSGCWQKFNVCVCVTGGGADGAGGEAGLLQAVVPACREGGGGGEPGGGTEERGETDAHTCTWQGHLVTAVCLQVKEEAGFDCEPVTLLLIQEQGPQWIRFIFLARITGQGSQCPGLSPVLDPLQAELTVCLCVPGGSLKTLSSADQESLQASWWDRQSVLPLRGRDILRLIDCGLKYDFQL